MPIYIRCPYSDCKRLVPYERDTCKCGRKLPVTGRYYYLWFWRGGRKTKISLGKCTVDYARRKEAELSTAAPSRKPISWREIRYAYLRKLEAERKSAKYQSNTGLYLRRFGEFWGDETTADQITPALIKDFQLKVLETPIKSKHERLKSKYSADRHLAAGRAAFGYCVDALPNPFHKVSQYNPGRTVKRILTVDEQTRMLAKAQEIFPPLFEMLVVALSTGLRKGNVLYLKRSEVDLARRAYTVIAKRGREHSGFFNEVAGDVLAAIPDNGTDYFWVNPRTGRPYHVDWRKTWYRVKKAAEIDPKFRFHDLRHTVGTMAYLITRDLGTVQRLLGHSDMRTTQIYAAVPEQLLRELAEKLVPTLPPPPQEKQ